MEVTGGIDNELQQDEIQEKSKIISMVDEVPKRRPFHYWKVGDRELRLKLKSGMIEKVESKYRQNIMTLMTEGDGIPPLSYMLTVLQAAAVPWEHDISYNKIQNLYDKWMDEEGGSQMKLYTEIIMPTLAVSGFFTDAQAASLMENMKDIDSLV